jgi:RNA polymerase sigma-70 factor, ECF subfamily
MTWMSDGASVTVDPGFEQLYRAEGQAVFSTVYLLCRDRALAEDATQEAFARALERWNRLGNRTWAAGWVTTTALNVARRALRHRRVSFVVDESQSEPEAAIDLWRHVRALPPRQQHAVILCYRLDLPVEEAARVMACRVNAARRRIAQVLLGATFAAASVAPLAAIAHLSGDQAEPDRPADSRRLDQPPPSLEFTLTHVPKGLVLVADQTDVFPADALEEVPGGATGLVLHSRKYGVPEAADGILGNIPEDSPVLDVWVSRAPFDLEAEVAERNGTRPIDVRGRAGVLIPPQEPDGPWVLEWEEQGLLASVLGTNLPLDEILAVAEGLRLGS